MAKFTEYQDMISAELETAGISSYSFSIGGKHPFVEFEFNGKTHKRVFPGTPSDRRSFLNQKMDFRRKLCELGAGVSEKMSEPDNVAVETTDMVIRDGSVIVSSLTLAEKFGRDHKSVLRAIDNVLRDLPMDFTERNLAPSVYEDNTGRSVKAYDMTRDGFVLVAMGFIGKEALAWKVKFIEAFNAMETALRDNPMAPLEARIAKLEGDLSAMTELLMEVRSPIAIASPQQTATIIKFKIPYVSERAVARRAARRQAIN